MLKALSIEKMIKESLAFLEVRLPTSLALAAILQIQFF